MSGFPIIDVASVTKKYLKDEKYLQDITSDPDMQSISKQIIDAFTEYGFIYLKGHNLPEDLVQKVFKNSEHFFKGEQEIKNRFLRDSNENWGYVPFKMETFEKQRPFDLKECFNYLPKTSRREDMNDAFPGWIDTNTKFFDTCKSLAMLLLKVISIGLNTDNKEWFLFKHHNTIGDFDNNPTTLRLLYYPSIESKEVVMDGQLRCGEHSDYGTITLLFQDSAGGLQVVSPSGEYVNATPIPGCIVVNAGDMLQIWSGNRIKSTRHRVVVPQNIEKPRQSVAFFVHPNNDSIVKNLENCKDDKGVNPLEYLMRKFAESY